MQTYLTNLWFNPKVIVWILFILDMVIMLNISVITNENEFILYNSLVVENIE